MTPGAIALYAAILSTITFCWRIFEYYDTRKGKLKIIIAQLLIIKYDENNQMISNREAYLLKILNNSTNVIFIEYIEAVFWPNNHEKIMAGAQVKIEPYHYSEYRIEHENFEAIQNAFLEAGKFRILCWDITGKHFISKKFKRIPHISTPVIER